MAVGKMLWRAGHKAWCCKVDAKFTCLGPREDAAAKYYRQPQIENGVTATWPH